MRTRLAHVAVATLAVTLATSGAAVAAGAGAPDSGTASPQGAATASATTSIEVQANQPDGTVSQAVMGSTYLDAFGGMGSFDDQTDSFYPSFLKTLKNDVYTGSLRFPGGINAQYYDWRRAVGPQDRRTETPYGPSQGPSESTVGPDEFGQLLAKTGATGIVTTNFATGDATEAAEFVQYMNGKPGSSYWADQRVKNGHTSPYRIPVWEVGNEEYTAASSWRAGTPVSLGPGGSSCTADAATCEYIYGGSTSFTNQPVVGYADRSAAAADSTGAANQSFYAAYAPISAGSQTVSVGGQAWTEVSSLADAAPTDDVYTVDDATGKITFGDGTHGAIPASGAQVTLSYVSGEHSGFLDYYREMKKADPSIKVCSTDTSDAFVDAMGSTLPYDCFQVHPYLSSGNASVDISSFERTSMAEPDTDAATLEGWKSTLKAATGRNIPIVLTEYGALIGSTPDPSTYPYYDESLDEAVFNASQLADWIKEGIAVADRQLLTAEQPDADNVTSGLPGAAPKAVTGAITTPGPQVVAQPTGRYFKLFQPLAGGTLLDSSVLNNPTLTSSGSTITGDLSVVAAAGRQTTNVVVINRDPDNDVASTLNLNGVASGGTATVTTLNGPSALSYNTADAPDTVTTSTSHAAVSNGGVALTFPAHSITLVQVHSNGPVVTMPSATAAAQSATVTPGSTDEVTATITNAGKTTVSGRASAIVPSGWSDALASGSTASYTLAPGASTTATYDVTTPASLQPGSYDVGVAVTNHGLTTSVGAVSLQLPAPPPGTTTTPGTPPSTPQALADTFNNVGITDDSDVTPGEYDGVGNSYSAEALAAGGLTPGGTFTSDGLSFTWPNVTAGTNDNTLTQGQVIAVSGSGNALGVVGASSTGLLTGTGTVYYTDGTESTYTLTLADYFNASDAATAGDNVVLTTSYINDSNSSTNGGSVQRQQEGTIYEQSVPIVAGKTVEAVQLPNNSTVASGGRVTGMHVFAVAVGSSSSVGTSTNSTPPSAPQALADTFNNVGITDDSDVTPGEYDGVGNSFSAEALAAGGLTPGATYAADGLSFAWPNVAAGTNDNTLTQGQVIAVSGSGTKLGFVGTSTSGVISGTGTVYYTDGTASTYTLSLGRYFYATDAAATGDNVVLTMPYINDSDSSTNGGSVQRQQAGTLFEQSVPITAGKTVEAVQLPNDTTTTGGRITGMHVFSIAVG